MRAVNSLVCTGKRILIGDRYFPFGGLTLIAESSVEGISYKFNGGSSVPITIGEFTDLVSAAKFLSFVAEEFGSYHYELTIEIETDALVAESEFVCGILFKQKNKSVEKGNKVRVFSDLVAGDVNYIKKIEYKIGAGALTEVGRKVKYTGNATSTSPNLIVTGINFEHMGVVGDVVRNITDGSEGVITEVDGNTLYAVLAGGSLNSWTAGDVYNIVDGSNVLLRTRELGIEFASSGLIKVLVVVTDLADNTDTAECNVFVG